MALGMVVGLVCLCIPTPNTLPVCSLVGVLPGLVLPVMGGT